MEVKISSDRHIRRKDPVVAKEGVFSCIEEASLQPTELKRIENEEIKEQQPAVEKKIWTIKEIANRLAIWLHLKKIDH